MVDNILLTADDNEGIIEGNKVSVNINNAVTYYENLLTAIENAPDNEETVITLLANIEIGSEITILENRKIVIDGNSSYTITRSKDENGTWYTGRLFNVKATGELTLKNITIDEGNIWTFNKEAYDDALLNAKQVTDTYAFITSQEDAPDVKGWTINNSGTLNVINSAIKNHYSSSSIGLFYGPSGSKIILKDTTITHCASTGSGVVASITGANSTITVEEGVIIDGNYAGGNGGIFKIYNSAVVTMNGGIVSNTTSLNTNGVVSMTYGVGSTFIMNGGTLTGNSGVYGKNNGRNAPIYVHSGSKFIMNGGTIENNFGMSTGGVDVAGHANAGIELNGGTIQNNETPSKNSYRSDLYIGNDYNLVLGEDMEIDGNVYIKGDLTNNGTINGNVTLDLSSSQDTTSISGTGEIKGDLVVYYVGEQAPEINQDIVINGDLVSCHNETQILVTFEYNGGIDADGRANKMLAVDINTIPVPPTPIMTGYSLKWYTDKELTTEWVPTEVSAKTTLYAGWSINSYKATWNVDGVKTTKNFNYGETITMPVNPTKIGYTFSGWSNYKENMTMPANDIIFEAKWTVNKYKITFNTNGGSSMASITKNYGEVITISSTPTKTGYSFSGWNGYTQGMKMPDKDLTFTAKWTIRKYTITFNTNGGTVIAPITQNYGTILKKPTDPIQKCKKLVGWYTDESLTTLYDFNTKITKDITLYAKWEDNHTWGEWKYHDENHHIRICVNDSSHTELEEHSGGHASYIQKAICDICQDEYGPYAEKINYTIVSGNNSTYIKGSQEILSFTTDSKVKFIGLKVDNKDVEAINYEIINDGVEIKLKLEYLESLSKDIHTITIRYEDGEAAGKFEIKQTKELLGIIPIIVLIVIIVLISTVLVIIKKKNNNKNH